MFAYCLNNPVGFFDKAGTACVATKEQRAVYCGCFPEIALPGQFKITLAATYTIAPIMVILGAIFADTSTTTDVKSEVSTEEKTEAIVTPTEPDGPVIFPVDPNSFNPAGLTKVPRVGTKNGAVISWMDPLTNTEVFRWDENPNKPNGPHYHINDPIYKNADVHFYPNADVPEPYATRYFPFG